MTANEKKFLTIEDMVARYGGAIKAGALANWRFQKKGPVYIKIGGRVVYPLEEVIKWEEQRTKREK